MGAGCEARQDFAQAEGQGGVQSRRGHSRHCLEQKHSSGVQSALSLETSHRVDRVSGGCLSPGSQLGSAGVAKLRSLHLIWDSVEPVKYLTGQVEI